jgi:hypothetical protein
VGRQGFLEPADRRAGGVDIGFLEEEEIDFPQALHGVDQHAHPLEAARDGRGRIVGVELRKEKGTHLVSQATSITTNMAGGERLAGSQELPISFNGGLPTLVEIPAFEDVSDQPVQFQALTEY